MKKITKLNVSLTLALAVTMMICVIVGFFDIMLNGRGSIKSILALLILIATLTYAFYTLLGAIEE